MSKKERCSECGLPLGEQLVRTREWGDGQGGIVLEEITTEHYGHEPGGASVGMTAFSQKYVSPRERKGLK
jgi:hypothetical protein